MPTNPRFDEERLNIQISAENVTGPPPHTVYFGIQTVTVPTSVAVDYGDGFTDTILVNEDDATVVMHTYQDYGNYVAVFTHPVEGSATVEISVEDEPAPDDDDQGESTTYQLVITRDHGGGMSSSAPYPFPAVEPVMDAAEAVAAVYLANDASEVALIKTEKHVTRTVLNPQVS